MIGIVLFVCLTLQTIGTYIIWPSRYNIGNHISLGFIFVAYFVPLIVLDFSTGFSTDIIDLYLAVTLIGTACYIIGLLIGNFLPLIKIRYLFHYLPNEVYAKKCISITQKCIVIGIVGMIISFLVMGFVPAFASDPLSAKFFKGSYHDAYMRVAILYRLSYFLLQTMMPIAVIVWYYKKSVFNVLLIVIPVILLLLTLSRTAAFSGIIIGLGYLFAYKSRILIFLYSVFLILIYSIGSLSFYLVGLIFGIDSLLGILPDGSVWELIASGSPDIKDQLTFLTAFKLNSVYTYGRTIFGGLIPGNYKWNPSIYTLMVENPGTDVSDISSGGLRLPVPLWGYVSFGWVGVVVYSLMAGLITAFTIKYAKEWSKGGDLMKTTIVLLLVGAIGGPLSSFYILSMYSVPIILAMLLYCYQFKLK